MSGGMSGDMSPLALGLVTVCVFSMLLLVLAATSARSRYTPRPLMTGNEREFFHRLVRANQGGYVFAQVAMSALVDPRTTNPRARLAAFRKISQKRIDYSLHAPDLALICVVELDDRTHDTSRDRERDALLTTAGIRTLRWNSAHRPSVYEIRAQIAAVQSAVASGREG
jgi:hypothetical protein